MDRMWPEFELEATEVLEEFWSAANIMTDGGEILRVYRFQKVCLEQAIIVVADGKVYSFQALWENAGNGHKQGARMAAARGATWIGNTAESVRIQGVLLTGGRWCAHMGFSPEV